MNSFAVIPSEVEAATQPPEATRPGFQSRGAIPCYDDYFEAYSDPRTAITREKQLKRWSRAKKEALIARRNPKWRDLFEQMYAVQKCNDSL